MKGLATAAAGGAAVVLALAGCGSEESGFASVPGAGGSPFDGPARSEVRIDMREIDFAPQRVLLEPGATVTWLNRDRVAHTVTKGSVVYSEFDSGDIEPGGAFRRTFEEPGDVRYRCTIHANMEGVLRVAGR